MILPVTAYGMPILRKKALELKQGDTKLNELIENMYDTMYKSSGVGLAAPQVNLSLQLFIIDADPFTEFYKEAKGFKKEFINPKIIDRWGKKWAFNEGCLSVPKINEDVQRPSNIKIQYYDRNFVFHEEEYDGILARVMQHEYDHIQGILFIDHLSSIRKTLLKRKLNDIMNGKVKVDYKMLFAKNKHKK